MPRDTYPKPADGWVCFHCGERFLSTRKAREHFGPTPISDPACQLAEPELRRQLRQLRSLEKLLHEDSVGGLWKVPDAE